MLKPVQRRLQGPMRTWESRHGHVHLQKDAPVYPQAAINCVPPDTIHLIFCGQESFTLCYKFVT